jgi:hypothetical protein
MGMGKTSELDVQIYSFIQSREATRAAGTRKTGGPRIPPARLSRNRNSEYLAPSREGAKVKKTIPILSSWRD